MLARGVFEGVRAAMGSAAAACAARACADPFAESVRQLALPCAHEAKVGALADVRDEHEGEADGCGDVDDGEREERDVDDREGGAEGEGGLGGLERAEKEPGDDGERVRAL